MLIKHLLSKCPALLGGQGKNSVSLWHYAVRSYGRTGSTGSEDSEEKWHSERFTCRICDPPTSPIDIISKNTICREYLPITLTGYDTPGTRMILSNNGYLVKIDFPDGELRYTGGGVYEKYKTDHVHFHWGHTSMYGSEHTVDGQNYPMEMHIVNHNMQFKSLAAAQGKGTGLAVLAFLFKRSSSTNHALSPITDMLREIKTPYTSVPLQLQSLLEILPGDREHYFQYTDVNINGFPTIHWTVFKQTIDISENQLAQFRSLNSSEIDPETKKHDPLGDNNRAPEDIPNLAVFVNEFEEPEIPQKKKKKSLGKKILSLFGKKKK